MKRLTLVLLSLILTAGFAFSQAHLTIQAPKGVEGGNVEMDPAGLLYAQMNPGTGTAVASQIFPDFGDCIMQGADDFTVPGGGWIIGKIEVIGTYSFHPGPANSFDVFFYADNAGQPGTEVYHGAGLAYTQIGDVYGVNLTTPANLPAGSYWISVAPNMAFGVGGQWFWQSHLSPVIGSQFFWQDPCQLASPYLTWTPASIAFSTAGITDLCFALYGPTETIPVSNWALIIGLGLIATFVIIRFRKLS